MPGAATCIGRAGEISGSCWHGAGCRLTARLGGVLGGDLRRGRCLNHGSGISTGSSRIGFNQSPSEGGAAWPKGVTVGSIPRKTKLSK